MKKLRKYHKWPSLIIGFFLLHFAVSGIIMNHRDWFSDVNVSRKLMPKSYRYNNWNLASVKGNVPLSKNRQLIYGNVGIWITDSTFSHFEDFNKGIGRGADHRKTFTVFQSDAGNLYAGTLWGLYHFSPAAGEWEYIELPEKAPRVVKLMQQDDRILVLTRSHLFTIPDRREGEFGVSAIHLPPANNGDGKTGLFRTLWVTHSGELFGLPGKILVDLVGLSLIFIVLSGYYYTFLPSLARRSGESLKRKLRRINRFSINWHNNLGIYGLVFLLLTTITGMFLRPPLLIPIAYTRVSPIPGSMLSHSNPWNDKLRDMVSDPVSGELILSTSEGFYHFTPGKDSVARAFRVQPDVSLMGITVFEPRPDHSYIIGSLSGIYIWYPAQEIVLDYVTGLPAQPRRGGSPFGSLAVAGMIFSNGNPAAMLEYDAGWIPLKNSNLKPEMPEVLRKEPISLWSVALEVHTGRIFSVFLGDFYILYVPLIGLTNLLIIITGVIMWLKIRNRKAKKEIKGGQIDENHQIKRRA